jgi:probable rRNA maturation factor
MPIIFSYADSNFNKASKTNLKNMALQVFANHNKQIATIRYIFCSDKYLLEINNQMLQHNYYTDIITFPLSEKDQPLEAEIYISIDRVVDNAQQFKTTFAQEIARVVAHGALHLCGYKDKTKLDIASMRLQESNSIAYFESL